MTATNRKKKKNGFILLDVIITMFVAAIALVSILGGIATASMTVGRSAIRIENNIKERNEWEKGERINTSIQ